MQGMKALVTGATGFVGSHIARELTQQGHSVRVLHRATSRLDALRGLEYESALGDILDSDALAAACAGCDWVFHVAAVADYWRSKTDPMYQANVEGTRRVLEAARAAGVRRVIFTSSAAAVGLRADGQPAPESEPFNLKPAMFPYGHSKALAEAVVAEAVAQGQDVVITNPAIVMGPGDLNMISGTFIAQVRRLGWLVPVTSGGISVTDVRDVARWHVAAAHTGRSGERYILTTANYTNREWFAMIADTVGVRRPFLPVPDFTAPIVAAIIRLLRRVGIPTPIDASQALLGIRKVYFDGSKAHRELGAPTIDMRASLQDTYVWYRDNGYVK